MRELLLPQRAAQHRAMTLPEGRLVDVELVGIDLALHDILAEAVGAGDEHHVAEAGLGVEREDDAARGQVGAHHLHHADRQADLEMVEAVVDAIDDGAVGEQRGEAAPAGLEHVVGAADVQKAFMLTGEAGGRQVLGGRRAAHRDRDVVAVLGFEFGDKPRATALAQALGAGGGVDDAARLLRALREQRDVGDVEVVEQRMQPRPRIGCRQRIAVGIGREGEAVRHAHAGLHQVRHRARRARRSCRRPAAHRQPQLANQRMSRASCSSPAPCQARLIRFA